MLSTAHSGTNEASTREQGMKKWASEDDSGDVGCFILMSTKLPLSTHLGISAPFARPGPSLHTTEDD